MSKRPDFKDLIQRDSKNVFLNPQEFAGTHTVDGKHIPVIIDNNEMIEREKRRLDQRFDGMYVKQLLIYVYAKDYGPLPALGKLLTLDGKRYRIVDAIDEEGMYSLSLEANKG